MLPGSRPNFWKVEIWLFERVIQAGYGAWENEIISHLDQKFFLPSPHSDLSRNPQFVYTCRTQPTHRYIGFRPENHPSTERTMTDWSDYRASHGVPGHRASLAHRGKPHAQALPHAHLCAQPRRGQVPVLVLLDPAPQGQEGQR